MTATMDAPTSHEGATSLGHARGGSMGYAGIAIEHGLAMPTAGDLAGLGDGVSPESIEAMRREARIRTFERGDRLIAEGDKLPIFVTLDGFVAVRRTDREGHQFTLVVMRPRQIVGLPSTWHPSGSMFDLVALTEGRALLLDSGLVRSLAERDAVLAVRLFDLAMDTLSLSLERLDEVTFGDARTRFATALLEYEPLLSADAPVITRDELASLIGASREMLGSVIRQFETSGIILRSGRQIVILDRPAIESIADWGRRGLHRGSWMEVVGANPGGSPDR